MEQSYFKSVRKGFLKSPNLFGETSKWGGGWAWFFCLSMFIFVSVVSTCAVALP